MTETTQEHRHLLREHVRSTGTLSHSVDVEGELLPLLNDADRLAAIEREILDLAGWLEGHHDFADTDPDREIMLQAATKLRAILDSPGQSRDMGDSDDPDVGRYR